VVDLPLLEGHDVEYFIRFIGGFEKSFIVLFFKSARLFFRVIGTARTAFAFEKGLNVFLLKIAVMNSIVFPRLTTLSADNVHPLPPVFMVVIATHYFFFFRSLKTLSHPML
jgi:hypothetical protein